ncbi:zinc ribbon domain-containing protein [Roseburia hominis]|uniref:DUF6320 domain-containing protein n=1 Tax=Roseburia hominis TaxID=301301 RepID=UPI001F36F43E|nr:zinc ribbon domain-containing protein [Roseburia hominis]MEE1248839.1 DUF6320 domain-containing protein [Lachnospiraceae bacterium]
MAKCKQCKIEIIDHVSVCPLCGSVLEDVEEGENTYPNIRFKDRKILLFLRIFLFVAILSEILLIYLNAKYFKGIYWSAISGGAMAYAYFTMRFAVLHNAGYRTKLILQVISSILLVVLIDWSIGFTGWSLNYVLPAGILVMDLVIIILMIVNSRNWQSYMLFQIFMILWSFVPLIFYHFHLVTKPDFSIIALIGSACLFLGTFIIGGRRASTELKRRFHVR